MPRSRAAEAPQLRHDKPAVERILNAALSCLSQSDPAQLSMREIAEAAGVSKSLLLYHFENKEELLLAVIDGFFGTMIQRIEAVTLTLMSKKSDAALHGSLHAIWYELRQAGAMPGIFLRLAAAGTLDDPLKQRLIRFRTRLVRIIGEGLKHTLPEQAKTLDADAIAELILACFVGLEANRLFAEDPRVFERAFAMVTQGLALATQLGALDSTGKSRQ
ncbi:MAG: TetR/AcrR family transcriptional regulator [Deltaproteobacteria bacterium]|nr:TetR/AcrR family transcriptional regulator [Deltaproteobacteria bacterium]